MGSLDRPGEPPDVPDEAGPAKRVPGPDSGPWLNLDNESEENLRAFLGLDREDRLPDLAEAVEVPEFSVLAKDWDVVAGVEPPDYRNPDAKDSLGLERGQEVIVGKHGSEDNPRRVAEVQDNGRLLDKADEPEPELPSGEELLELEDDEKSKYEQIVETGRRADFIENVESSGARTIGTIEDLIRERPQPTGAYAGTPEHPAVQRADRDALHGGELVVAPILVGLLVHHGVSAVRDWLRHEKQSTGA
jgi:hypothetical protein